MKGISEFLKYTTASITGMIFLSCYVLADTFFIANGLGANGLASLNIALPIYSVVHGCGLMIGIGGSTKYSIFQSRGDKKSADKYFLCSLILATVFAAVFVTCGLCFSGKLSEILGADESLFEMTEIYIRVILLFSPAFLLNNVIICFVRNDGVPKTATAAMSCGSVANIFLDWLFVFPMNLGMFGAVFATGLAPIISLFVLSSHFIGGKCKIALKSAKVKLSEMLQILATGLASFIGELASGIIMIVFNFVMLSLLGNVGVAAYGVVANLAVVAVSVFTGLSQGMQPILSRAWGERNESKLRDILRLGFISALLLSALVYLPVCLFANQIAAAFNSTSDMLMQSLAVDGMKLYFSSLPFVGISVVITVWFTSCDRAFYSHIISAMRGFLVIVPTSLIMSGIFGEVGLWLSYPMSEMICCAVGVILFLKNKRRC